MVAAFFWSGPPVEGVAASGRRLLLPAGSAQYSIAGVILAHKIKGPALEGAAAVPVLVAVSPSYGCPGPKNQGEVNRANLAAVHFVGRQFSGAPKAIS